MKHITISRVFFFTLQNSSTKLATSPTFEFRRQQRHCRRSGGRTNWGETGDGCRSAGTRSAHCNQMRFHISETFSRKVSIPPNYSGKTKEIVERRHGEPIKFLFLPKMGLLGSQASTEKKFGCEFWATFEGYFFMFSWAIFLNILGSALKRCLITKLFFF